MKKIISLLTVLILAFSLSVSAGALPKPSATTANTIKDAQEFKPAEFKSAHIDKELTVDGTKDAEYGNPIEIKVPTSYDYLKGDQAVSTATAYTAWSDSFLYVFVEVNDKTPHGNGDYYNTDGVEIFVDYDQVKSGKKTPFNQYPFEDGPCAAQLTFVRKAELNEPSNVGTGNLNLQEMLVSISCAVVDNNANGYVLETAIPLKNDDGEPISKSNVLGFTININDDISGGMRECMMCTTDDVQAYAWQWTNLFDNLVLEGGESMTWSSRTVNKNIIAAYALFDPADPTKEIDEDAEVKDETAEESGNGGAKSSKTESSENAKSVFGDDAKGSSTSSSSTDPWLICVIVAVAVVAVAVVAVIIGVVISKNKKSTASKEDGKQ